MQSWGGIWGPLTCKPKDMALFLRRPFTDSLGASTDLFQDRKRNWFSPVCHRRAAPVPARPGITAQDSQPGHVVSKESCPPPLTVVGSRKQPLGMQGLRWLWLQTKHYPKVVFQISRNSAQAFLIATCVMFQTAWPNALPVLPESFPPAPLTQATYFMGPENIPSCLLTSTYPFSSKLHETTPSLLPCIYLPHHLQKLCIHFLACRIGRRSYSWVLPDIPSL